MTLAACRMMKPAAAVVAGVLALAGHGPDRPTGGVHSAAGAGLFPPVAAAALVLEATIPLADVRGRIDHMAVDPGRTRLIVAELGNNTVDVVDLASRRLVHRITGLHAPQGVAYAPNADLILVTNAGDGSVRMYQANGLKPVGRIALSHDADNVHLDRHRQLAVVGYGNGGLAIIDPATRVKIAEIRLPAHPEGFQIEPESRQAFVNIPDAGVIAMVTLEGRRMQMSWKMPFAGNFPMALDSTAHLLATVFRAPPRLVLLDSHTKAVREQLPACDDADDVFFDHRRRRIYVSCGAGEIAVFQVDGETYRALAPVRTAHGARTSLFVPGLDRLFVARPARPHASDSAILVFRPVP